MSNKTIKQTTTINLKNYIEDHLIFKLSKDNKLFLDIHDESDDGTFETPKYWIDLMVKLDDDVNSGLIEFYFGNQNERKNTVCNFDGFKIHLVDEKEKSPNFEVLKLIFDEPQNFVFGEIGFGDNKEFVTKEISELYCNFDIEAYWKAGNDKLQAEFCNIIEVYLSDIVFIK